LYLLLYLRYTADRSGYKPQSSQAARVRGTCPNKVLRNETVKIRFGWLFSPQSRKTSAQYPLHDKLPLIPTGILELENLLSTSHEIKPCLKASSLAPGTILQNRYRIVRQLGKGGMGSVYEAVDQRLGVTIALKETFSAEPSALEQFAQEARLLARLQHPALPRVTDHFSEGNRAFLVMQFITGVDLAKIIAQQPGPFPRDQVVAWADQLLDALIYLHSQERQVIHRDIKPHNLKLTPTGQIALLDFGLAKAQPADSSSGVSTSAAFFGYTRQYAPLEQIQDLATGPESDIYALGATLYYLLTGHKPVDALTRAAALTHGEADPLRPANEIYESVGPEIAAILNKAMAQKPEERYTSASEFREVLRCVGRTGNNLPNREERTRQEGIDPKKETTVLKSQDERSTPKSGGVLMALILLVSLAVASGVFYENAVGSAGPPDETTIPYSAPSEPANSLADRANDARGNTDVNTKPDAPIVERFRDGETNVETKALDQREPNSRKPAQVKRPYLILPKDEFRNYRSR